MFNRRPIAVSLPTGKEHTVSDPTTTKRSSLHKRISSLATPLNMRRKKRLAAASSSSSSSSSGSGLSAPESDSPEPMAIDLSALAVRPPFPWSPSPPSTGWARSPLAHAPVARVPAELLSHIFALHADADPDAGTASGAHQALRLSHVCAQWRAIAHNSSGLWAALHIGPSTAPALVAHALALSRTHPLALALTAPASSLPSPAARHALLGLAGQLAPHLWRVARLSVCTDDLHALETLLTPLLDGAAPALRSLTLSKPADATYDIRAILPPSFLAGPPGLPGGSTPALEELRLGCIGLAWHSPVLLGGTGARLHTLDLSHLTGPNLPALAYDDFRSILHAHPSLQHLVLRCTGPLLPSLTIPGTPVLHSEPIALPQLQSLKISAMSRGPYVTQLLQLLHTPALETLELSELDFDGWAGFVEGLRAHADDSNPRALHSASTGARLDARAKYANVRALRLYNSCILADVEDVFFRAFPILEHLTLYCVEADPFVRVLQAEAFAPHRRLGARSPAFVVDASAGSKMSVAGSPAARDGGWAPSYEVAPEAADCIWPYLHTMSLRCMYNEKALRATVEARALIGRPLKTLRLEESLVSRLGDGTMKWLSERTKVEEFIYKGY